MPSTDQDEHGTDSPITDRELRAMELILLIIREARNASSETDAVTAAEPHLVGLADIAQEAIKDNHKERLLEAIYGHINKHLLLLILDKTAIDTVVAKIQPDILTTLPASEARQRMLRAAVTMGIVEMSDIMIEALQKIKPSEIRSEGDDEN